MIKYKKIFILSRYFYLCCIVRKSPHFTNIKLVFSSVFEGKYIYLALMYGMQSRQQPLTLSIENASSLYLKSLVDIALIRIAKNINLIS